MKTSLDIVHAHNYLSEEETLRRQLRLWRLQWLSLALVIFLFPLALVVTRQGLLIHESLHAGEGAAWIAAIGSFLWFIYLSLSHRQYRTASAKELARLRPMLDGDEAIREAVAGWAQLRPLQERDARLLTWLMPQWQQEQATIEFSRSLTKAVISTPVESST